MRGWVNKFSQLLFVGLLGLCLPHCDGGTSSTRFDGGSAGTGRTVEINGVVVDPKNNGIPKVKVSVRNGIGMQPNETLTDEEGYFMLEAELLPEDPVELRFEKDRVVKDIKLPAESIQYPEISVKATLDEEKEDVDVDFILPSEPPSVLPTTAAPSPDPGIPTDGGPVMPSDPGPEGDPASPNQDPPAPSSTQSSSSASSQAPATPRPLGSPTQGPPGGPITPATPTPTATPAPIPPPACPDFDGDGDVDLQDLAIILSTYGTSDPATDVIQNGIVDQDDVDYVVSQFGTNCP